MGNKADDDLKSKLKDFVLNILRKSFDNEDITLGANYSTFVYGSDQEFSKSLPDIVPKTGSKQPFKDWINKTPERYFSKSKLDIYLRLLLCTPGSLSNCIQFMQDTSIITTALKMASEEESKHMIKGDINPNQYAFPSKCEEISNCLSFCKALKTIQSEPSLTSSKQELEDLLKNNQGQIPKSACTNWIAKQKEAAWPYKGSCPPKPFCDTCPIRLISNTLRYIEKNKRHIYKRLPDTEVIPYDDSDKEDKTNKQCIGSIYELIHDTEDSYKQTPYMNDEFHKKFVCIYLKYLHLTTRNSEEAAHIEEYLSLDWSRDGYPYGMPKYQDPNLAYVLWYGAHLTSWPYFRHMLISKGYDLAFLDKEAYQNLCKASDIMHALKEAGEKYDKPLFSNIEKEKLISDLSRSDESSPEQMANSTINENKLNELRNLADSFTNWHDKWSLYIELYNAAAILRYSQLAYELDTAISKKFQETCPRKMEFEDQLLYLRFCLYKNTYIPDTHAVHELIENLSSSVTKSDTLDVIMELLCLRNDYRLPAIYTEEYKNYRLAYFSCDMAEQDWKDHLPYFPQAPSRYERIYGDIHPALSSFLTNYKTYQTSSVHQEDQDIYKAIKSAFMQFLSLRENIFTYDQITFMTMSNIKLICQNDSNIDNVLHKFDKFFKETFYPVKYITTKGTKNFVILIDRQHQFSPEVENWHKQNIISSIMSSIIQTIAVQLTIDLLFSITGRSISIAHYYDRLDHGNWVLKVNDSSDSTSLIFSTKDSPKYTENKGSPQGNTMYLSMLWENERIEFSDFLEKLHKLQPTFFPVFKYVIESFAKFLPQTMKWIRSNPQLDAQQKEYYQKLIEKRGLSILKCIDKYKESPIKVQVKRGPCS